MKALILGCSGPILTNEERDFFRQANPWGFILFKRNIVCPDQVRDLTAALRDSVGRLDAPILVDQEGGRVQRLREPYWPSYPVGSIYGSMPKEFAYLGAQLIAADLREVGITANCAPVLDVPIEGASDVIGDRAYDTNPDRVSVIGKAMLEGFLAGGILPIIKHIPGHGRGNADSHHALPIVESSEEELISRDFIPFKALSNAPLAMTAHVVYSAIDPHNPATVSSIVIQRIIREYIGFDGLLLTDDLSMNALSGSISERAQAALKAGCDVALHCNGVLTEMQTLAEAVSEFSDRSEMRLKRIREFARPALEKSDLLHERARFQAAVAQAIASSQVPSKEVREDPTEKGYKVL